MSEAERIRQQIARLRAEVWANRTDEDKRNGTGWVCLDYVKMNRIEELNEKLDKLEAR